MDRSRVTELHYLTPIANLSSIAKRGILSHRRADQLRHVSIADEGVQDRRRAKRVPNGRMLHDYVNVYFDARNPMMYVRLSRRRELAVVRVSPAVLDLPGTVITDGNAAADATCFLRSPAGITALDEDRVYAEYWTDTDYWTQLEKKRQRCAEILVPDVIPAELLMGCYVCDDNGLPRCQQAAPDLEVEVNAHVFFT